MTGPGGETQSQDAVAFDGQRWPFLGLLLRGYLLMVPTLGVYRFWLTTRKRRYYWQNTSIGGDALEYTGNARQLLFGFLFALAFFLPVYVGFFVLSTQAGIVTVIGYLVLGALFWFFIGYAQYRGRDFRLSRTLWRGIRFDQKGSAMAYATRRFFWSIAVMLTLGLLYPAMSASLWNYRYTHTWFGDRQMSFAGTWKTVAGPFYHGYLTVAGVSALMVTIAISSSNPVLLQLTPLTVLCLLGIFVPYWRSRELSRMFSSVRLGDAAVTTRVRARTLIGQYSALGALLFLLLIIAGAVSFAIVMSFYRETGVMTGNLGSLAFTGWGGAAIVVGSYLLGFGTFSLLVETIIDFGFWKAVARGTTINNLASLETIRATNEDTALVGEGLADALNVGSF